MQSINEEKIHQWFIFIITYNVESYIYIDEYVAPKTKVICFIEASVNQKIIILQYYNALIKRKHSVLSSLQYLTIL